MFRFLAAPIALAVSAAGAAGGDIPCRTSRMAAVNVAAGVPRDMAEPEGRTRWDLTAGTTGTGFARQVDRVGDEARIEERGGVAETVAILADPAGRGDALAWAFPERYRDRLRMGSRETLVLEERSGERVSRLTIRSEVVGVGWVHLPSGPREAVLQRARIRRDVAGTNESAAEILMHRWVDPLAGPVAEIWGTAAPDGAQRLDVTGAAVLEEVVTGAADLRIYVDELWNSPFQVLNYGWDKGAGTTVSSITPEHYGTIGQLIAANSWDFSANTTGTEVASSSTPVNSSETCNSTRCGYNVPGGQLERTDKNFASADPAQVDKINDVAQREDRTGDVTIWIRAGAQHEGWTGAFGTGESRFCYTTDGTGTRSPVPLWRFSHQDAGSWYLQAGDAWEGGPFNCEQNIFNQTCGAAQLFDKLWAKACGDHTGKQSVGVVKGGVVTLPSGHTFNALLVRNIADFCVYMAEGCSFLLKVDEVRTVVYLWQVPHLGSVVQLQSEQDVADTTSFTTLASTNFGFGLYPPRSITLTGTTETTASLSWDPGLDTRRISGYRVYWDTDSGGTGAYAHDSISNPSQVSFAGTTATISGLERGTTYYFTVTSRSGFKDPSTGVTTTFESLVYPTQAYGDPSHVYPVEVQGTTACTPSSEVQGLRASKVAGQVEFCWNAATDPCLVGYRILGADSPTSAAGFTVVADTGTETCWTGNPSQRYFLVVARGTGADGPWGHYGR